MTTVDDRIDDEKEFMQRRWLEEKKGEENNFNGFEAELEFADRPAEKLQQPFDDQGDQHEQDKCPASLAASTASVSTTTEPQPPPEIDFIEDIIDGFAFASFLSCEQMQKWTDKEELRKRKETQENCDDKSAVTLAGNDSSRSSATLSPKKHPKKHKESQRSSPLSQKQRQQQLQQQQPRSPSRQSTSSAAPQPLTADLSANSSPSTTKPEGGGSGGVEYVKKCDANGVDEDGATSVDVPVKVPKRENTETVPVVLDQRQNLKRNRSPIPQDSGGEATPVKTKKEDRSSSASIKEMAAPPSSSSSNINIKSGYKESTGVSLPTPNSISTSTPASSSMSAAGLTSTASDNINRSGVLFPGLFPTSSVADSAPYFRPDLHSHPASMQQYQSFLAPYLSGSGLSSISGMVGLTSPYNMPNFPIPPHVPALPLQLSTTQSAVAPKKKGRWCAMHVQIAWDIYNKSNRQEKKLDELNASNVVNHHRPSSAASSSSKSSVPTTSVQRSSNVLRSTEAASIPSQNAANHVIVVDQSKSSAIVDDRVRSSKHKHKSHGERASVITNESMLVAQAAAAAAAAAAASTSSSIGPPHNGASMEMKLSEVQNSRNSSRNSVAASPVKNAALQDPMTARHRSRHQQQTASVSSGMMPSSSMASSSSGVNSSVNFSSAAAAAAAVDNLFHAAALGIRPMMQPMTNGIASNFNSLSVNTDRLLTSAAASGPPPPPLPSFGGLAPHLAADRLRGAAVAAGANNTPMDMYRNHMGLDSAAAFGVGAFGRFAYDQMFRPQLPFDPMSFERDREQLIRLQQQFGVAVSQQSANPLASMIDLERNRTSVPGLSSQALPSVAVSGLVPSLPQQLLCVDGTSPAVYSTGLMTRDRMDMEQQMRMLSAAGQLMPPPPNGTPNMDALRLGLMGGVNPLLDPFLASRTLGTNAYSLNFGFGGGMPSLALGHLAAQADANSTSGLTAAAVSAANANSGQKLISPFSTSLEQLARQKRDALIPSAKPNMFQSR